MNAETINVKLGVDKPLLFCYHTCMMNVTTNCPVCNGLLVVTDTSDPSVGIFFDYDVLEGSTCTCDFENEALVKVIDEHVQEAIERAIYGDDNMEWADEWEEDRF